MNGFWGGRFESTFVDVRIFNPHADTNKTSSLSSAYLKHENEKRRTYEQRVREVERASFVPIVLSATGGMGKQASVFYKRLASLLAEKRDTSYSATMNTFSLLQSAVQCIRGARSDRIRALTWIMLCLCLTLLTELYLSIFSLSYFVGSTAKKLT